MKYSIVARAQNIKTGEIAEHRIKANSPSSIAETREKLLANGWLVLGIWNNVNR